MWLWSWAWVAAAAPLSLADALEEGLGANAELRQEALALGLSEWSLVRANSAFDPRLALSVDTSATNSPNNDQFVGQDVLRTSSAGWSAGLSQTLPTGGAASLTWSESTYSSNAQDVIAESTVSDRVTLSVSQPLLRGFGPAALWSVQGARLALDDTELRYRAAVEGVILSVSAGYWRLVSARTSLELAVRSREIAQQSLDDTRERFDEGFAGTGDVAQVERALGTAKQSEVVAVAEVASAEQALRRLLGREVLDEAELLLADQPTLPGELPGYDEVLELARQGNAQWLRDQLALERAELGVRETRNGALPDVSVTGAVGLSGLAESATGARQETLSGAFNDWSVGASMSVPLPARALRADLATAKLDRESAHLARDTAEQDLVLRVQEAIRDVERDRSRTELAADTVRVARLALDADQELLREGKGSTRDVVLSLDALDQATAAELDAQIDLQISLLELKRVAGTLID